MKIFFCCKLPNMLHFEWTMKALEAGKHVLNEKPSADTAEETRQMFELAERKGLVLLDAYHYRYEISYFIIFTNLRWFRFIGSTLLFIESKRFWKARSWVLSRIFQCRCCYLILSSMMTIFDLIIRWGVEL